MKFRSRLVVLGLVIALGLAFALAAPAEQAKPEVCFDKARCAEFMNYGREAFSRGKFSDAKGYFREAVKADPGSAKAWAFYDLCIMYDVADQVKKTGSVKVSGAPVFAPGAAAPPAASGSSSAPPPPKPAQPSGGAVIVDDEGC